MAACIFHEGPLPTLIALDYEPAIFNLPEFHALHDDLNQVFFYLVDQRKEKAVAGIHFHVEGSTAWSPYKAPFGSLECSKQINPRHLYGFIEEVELRLKQKGVREIFIKNPPRAYAPRMGALIETFLMNLNYTVSDAEISTVIPVTKESFSWVIRNSERLRLSQTKKASFEFRQLSAPGAKDVYDFIARCHAEKKYKLSIAWADFQKAFQQLPGRYLLFAVLENEEVRAAAVSVRVTNKILYNFLANHQRAYNHLSPPVLLMQGIYDHCWQNEIDLLDLGTSALNGKPNFSLLDFKLHIGGVPASKLSFYKRTG